jgi:hypothetical protein
VNDLGFHSRSDQINAHVVGGYRWTRPGRAFRSANLQAAIYRTYDFGGNRIWEGLWHSGFLQFRNYYTFTWNLELNPWTVSNRRTRGGPLMLTPSGGNGSVWLQSDDRKTWVFGLDSWMDQYGSGHQSDWGTDLTVDWKPAAHIVFSFGPSYAQMRTGVQYVDTYPDSFATATYGARYVFAHLDQTTLSANVRLNWIFTPKLSLELYAQPLLSSGQYSRFKELARANSYDFVVYGKDGGSTFDQATYQADPDGPGPAPAIQLPHDDFDLASLRGNAVLRWEYRPGSTIYVVWTQSRSEDSGLGQFALGDGLHRLFSTSADNILAVKFSYWWNP